ncbi:Uncharacterised protein [uncultured archaeon]|nr:Uncharacterised protein [uncultured archaeon]
MAAAVGVERLEEADAPAVVSKSVANTGKSRAPWGKGGCADIVPGPLSQSTKLLRVYADRGAKGVKPALLGQVGDLLQGDHLDTTMTSGIKTNLPAGRKYLIRIFRTPENMACSLAGSTLNQPALALSPQCPAASEPWSPPGCPAQCALTQRADNASPHR